MEVKFCVPALALSNMKYVAKLDRYVATIQFHGHPAKEFWMSKKQAHSLSDAFPEDSRYSTRQNTAFVILEEKDNKLRFIWAVLNEAKARESAKHFGASWGWPDEQNHDE